MNITTALVAARSRALALIGIAVLVLALTPTLALASPVRLMVDPGHGGTDPGAIGNGIAEKDTNFAISEQVVAAAKRQGWTVGMTRSRNQFRPLTERSAIANNWKATALVSIHSNSMGPAPRGNMTIHRGGKGFSLGAAIMYRMQRLTPYNDIGNRSDVRGLAVLRTAKVPAVIVEVLSVSSKPEAAVLKDPQKRSEYAEAIVMGVADFHGVEYVPPLAPKASSAPAPTPQAAPTPEPAAAAPEAAEPDASEPKDDHAVATQAAPEEARETSPKTVGYDARGENELGTSAADRGLEPISNWLDGLIGRLVGQSG
ncbi:MAG: N-acetylmuramoyl-L-alanine amidase family protein [Coriobacteriia bacterium]